MMLETLIKGGPVMIPLGICSVLALTVFVERMWYFWTTRFDHQFITAQLREPLRQGKYIEAMQLARQTPLGDYLSAGIACAEKGPHEMRLHLDVAGKEEVLRMERGLPILSVVTTVAPLLGLLGTVTGIIRSFRVLSALQGLEGPSALSTGIAEALITTATGLIIAIPSAAVYEWLNSIVDRRVQKMNTVGGEVVDIVAETRGEA